MWPAFVLFTAADGLLLDELPVSGNGPGGLVPALLIAALIFWNVTAIASPFVVILLLEIGVLRLLRKGLTEVLGSTEQAFDKLVTRTAQTA